MQKAIERKSLIVSMIINLIISGAGLWVFLITNIQALFLDFFFSAIGFISTIFAVIISKASKKRTEDYPDGLHFLEPLYGVLKSVLTISLMLVSAAVAGMEAFEYFVHGSGEPMNMKPVLPYAVCIVILCLGLGIFNLLQNRRINNTSTILAAESKSNIIDGLQSLGIGIAIALLSLTDINGGLGFLHYTGDFIVTIILVLFSIKEPVKILISSFKELSGGTVSTCEIKTNIMRAVNTHFGNTVDSVKCDIFKVGMYIKVRVIFNKEPDSDLLPRLKQSRQETLNELKQIYENIELVFVF